MQAEQRSKVIDVIALLRAVLNTLQSLGFVAKIIFPKYSIWITKIELAIESLEKLLE